MELFVYADGASRGNPGDAAIGFVIMNENGKSVHEFGEVIGVQTNNVAEYMSLIKALEFICEHYDPKDVNLHIFMDSNLVVQQVNGVFAVRNEKLRVLFYVVIDYLKQFRSWDISHIPRAQNSLADGMANRALDFAVSM